MTDKPRLYVGSRQTGKTQFLANWLGENGLLLVSSFQIKNTLENRFPDRDFVIENTSRGDWNICLPPRDKLGRIGVDDIELHEHPKDVYREMSLKPRYSSSPVRYTASIENLGRLRDAFFGEDYEKKLEDKFWFVNNWDPEDPLENETDVEELLNNSKLQLEFKDDTVKQTITHVEEHSLDEFIRSQDLDPVNLGPNDVMEYELEYEDPIGSDGHFLTIKSNDGSTKVKLAMVHTTDKLYLVPAEVK